MKKIFLSLFFLSLMISCASQRNEPKAGNELGNRLGEALLDFIKDHRRSASDAEINQKIKKREELPTPSVVAVYFQSPEPAEEQKWRWSRSDKDLIIKTIHDQRGNKISRVFELINTGAAHEDLKNLRLMAAQQGADALLTIQGAAATDTDANGWAVTYLAFLPAFFVRGSDVHGQFVAQALLWDVRNSVVHLGVESEGDWSTSRPFFFRQKERVINKSKEASMRNLSERLGQQLKATQL
jgi:hypothetical protein